MQPRDEDIIIKRFAALLVELRTSRGLTLRGAAKLIGIDHGRLSSLEEGVERTNGRPTRASVAQIIQIARAYRYPKERLLAEAGYIPWLLDQAELDQMLAFFSPSHTDHQYKAAERHLPEIPYGEEPL